MNKSRLLTLAKHLQNNVKDEEFSLDLWKNECGTVGCAVGHACSIPSFNKMGLGLREAKWRGETVYEPSLYVRCIDDYYDDWYAVDHFFKLEAEESLYLFSADSYQPGCTKQTVIDRIKNFVKTGEMGAGV